MTVLAYIFNLKQLVSVCLNSDCTMILISRKFLQSQNSIIKINSMFFIFIHNIKNIKFNMKFMIFKLYFSVILDENLILVQIQIKTYVVDDFKMNLLLDIDNMISKN